MSDGSTSDWTTTDTHEGGSPKTVQRHLPDGLQLVRTFGEDGDLLEEVVTREGWALEGVGISWHPNGVRKFEAHYFEGERLGPSVAWYDNGQRESAGDWKLAPGFSVMDGLWTFWYEAGDVRAQGEFRGGTEIGRWTYTAVTGADVEIDYGDGIEIDLEPVGFDSTTFRFIPLDEDDLDAGPSVPFNYMLTLQEWEQFVGRLATGTEIPKAEWGEDGLMARDHLADFESQHPKLAMMSAPADDAFRQLTDPSEALSPDRSEWWWQRVPSTRAAGW